MKKHIFVLLIITINFIGGHLVAQTDSINKISNTKKLDTLVVGVKKNNPVILPVKHLAPLDSEFIINNKKFRYYNNWITVGGGGQQNLTYNRSLGFIGGADFNFHVKRNYFQLGTLISGENYGFYTNYQLHFCIGTRYENRNFHYAAFTGVSFSTGYAKVGDSVYSRKYNQPGVYFEGEVIKKIAYDVGAGAGLFIDINAEQTILGLRFMVYFSGSYLGKRNKQYDER